MPQGLGFCLCVVGAHTCVRRLEDNLECYTRGATQEKDLNGSAINKASARHPEDNTHKHWDWQCSITSSFFLLGSRDQTHACGHFTDSYLPDQSLGFFQPVNSMGIYTRIPSSIICLK